MIVHAFITSKLDHNSVRYKLPDKRKKLLKLQNAAAYIIKVSRCDSADHPKIHTLATYR